MISVVMPVYNREATVLKAISSVLDQSYGDLELIVVNDGSTDNSEQKVLSVNDHRLKYIDLGKNQGACVARNAGVNASKGDFIAFQDSDDFWHRDKLEKQLEFIQTKGGDVIFCAISAFDEFDRNIGIIPPLDIEAVVTFDMLIYKSFISTVTIFGKRECFLDERFDPEVKRLQDWDLMLRVVKKYDVRFMNEALVDAYIQRDSISRDYGKGIQSLRLILSKHRGEMEIHRKAYANQLYILGTWTELNHENGKDVFRDSLRYGFAFKTFMKYILSTLKSMV
jgi:glycosyltransferase involved in cell wall biosynthesis